MRSPADPGEDGAIPRAEAALVSLSAVIAGGEADAVTAQAEGAVLDGASPQALYETVLQSYLFLGYPRAIEAFFAVEPMLVRQGAVPLAAAAIDPEAWLLSGETLCKKVYGRNYERLVKTLGGLSPDLASWMLLEGYGKTLSRPGLSATAREYCVVAILTTTRMWRQLRSHAIGAVNVGGTRAGVRRAIELCEPTAGVETVREALRVAGLEGHDARG